MACGHLQAIREGEEGVTAEHGATAAVSGFPAGDLDRVHPAHLAGSDTHSGAILHQNDGIGLHRLGHALGQQQILGPGVGAGAGGLHFPVLEGHKGIVCPLHQVAAADRAAVQALRALGPVVRRLQDAELLFGGEHFQGLAGEGRCQDHFPEVLGHDVRHFDAHWAVEGHDAAEGADRVPRLGTQEGLQGMGSLAYAAGVVVLVDDAGRSGELPDQAGAGIGIKQVVEAQFLPLMLVAGGHAFGFPAGLHVEGRRLVRVLAIAKALLLYQVQAEVVGQVCSLLGYQLPFHPAGNGSVVGRRPPEGLEGAAAAIRQTPGARQELLQVGCVLSRVGQYSD